jgi:hypothetical protein
MYTVNESPSVPTVIWNCKLSDSDKLFRAIQYCLIESTCGCLLIRTVGFIVYFFEVLLKSNKWDNCL